VRAGARRGTCWSNPAGAGRGSGRRLRDGRSLRGVDEARGEMRPEAGSGKAGRDRGGRDPRRDRTTDDERDLDGRSRGDNERGEHGNRLAEPGRAGGGGGHRDLNWCSDTMLGIDKLYSLGAKGHNI
jgi:hypothetical protein